MASKNEILGVAGTGLLRSVFPFLNWFDGYSRSDFRHDFVAGLTVALVLIPQSMAYAQLAGLPAHYGLYAAFLPPLAGALFGSSRHLATGPVAMVSLLTATALEPLATAGSDAYIAYAVLLSLMVGLLQLALGAFRLGVLVNFISHPVINGFANAAALIIATSQLARLFGVYASKGAHHYETVYNALLAAWSYAHWPTFGMGALAFAIMVVGRRINPKIPSILVAALITAIISWATGFEHNLTAKLTEIEPETVSSIRKLNGIYDRIQEWELDKKRVAGAIPGAEKLAGADSEEARRFRHQLELLDISIKERKEAARILANELRSVKFTRSGDGSFRALSGSARSNRSGGRIWRMGLNDGKVDENAIFFIGGGEVVGVLPRGLPGPRLPKLSAGAIFRLFPMALIIAFIGFLEAIFIAKSMAARTHQRLKPSRELVGQGLANLVGAVGSSFPVSGSFSRSAINVEAGAVTGMSSVISSLVVVAALFFLTPFLYYLPQSVMAAIIIVAVANLVDISALIHTWQANKWDAFITIATFISTLLSAPHLERGIYVGVAFTLGIYLFRNMKTDIAVLSRHPDGTYRNAERFNLELCKNIAVIRFNGPLFFANVGNLEETIIEEVASMPELRHILLVGNGIVEMDASGEEMISQLVSRLHKAGYDLSFSGLRDSILDVIRRTGLYERIGEENIFRNVAQAMEHIYERAHGDSHEKICPLIEVSFKGLKVAPSVRRRREIIQGPGGPSKTKVEHGYDFVI